MENLPAPAKINLFLHVLGRRKDGYHFIQTAFSFLSVFDEVSLRLRDDGRIIRVGELYNIPDAEDLTKKAAILLQGFTGTRKGVEIELKKQIPIGGGMGGGSSDAATTLIGLNHLWQANLSMSDLLKLALEIGADVPVFVRGVSAFGEGIGERLTPVEIPENWYLVIVSRSIIPTAKVYRDPELTRNSKAITIPAFFRGEGRNDLEPMVCKRYPEIADNIRWLRTYGDPRMTGSGGCVFCEFGSETEAQAVLKILPSSKMGFVAKGLARHPLVDGVVSAEFMGSSQAG